MENPGELQALCETVLTMGEELDTRCRFIRFGDNIYLVRNLLNLRNEQGLSLDEIAVATGRPKGSIKVALSTARKKMMAQWQKMR